MTHRKYHFGDCSIDVAARELRLGGNRVAVAPPVFDCIAYLLEHRDRAVGRDELVAAVWGRIQVADNLVGKTLVKARRAVGDNGAEQRVILTVPRFGFRWVATIRVDDSDAEPVAMPAAEVVATEGDRVQTIADLAADHPGVRSQATAALPMRERRVRWKPLVIGVLALACMAAGGFLLWQRMVTAPTAPANAPMHGMRIAVLPLAIAPDSGDAWLRLGLMDLMAQRLRSAGLSVVPSDDVVRIVRTDMDVEQAAAALRAAAGVSDILAAALRRAGDDWIVTINLRAADGHEREVEARAGDALSAGREAADQVVRMLGRALPPDRDDAATPLAELSQRVQAALLINDFAEARRLIAAAPAQQRASPELQLRLSTIDYRLGRSDEARARLEKLLPDLSAETEPMLRARALTGLAAVALKQNHAEVALPPLDQAVALLESRNDPVDSGHAYTGRGIAHAMQGAYVEAAADFARARVAFDVAGDSHALARIDINEGAMDSMRDRPADALPLLERASTRFAQLDAPTDLINSLGNLVEAHLALLQSSQALVASERMMPLLARIENPQERRIFLAIRARALAAVGRLAETRALLGQLMQNADAQREAAVLGQLRGLQARLDLDAGQAATAAVLARKAIDALDGPEFAHLRADAWRVAIEALLQGNATAEAATEGARFVAWADASGRDSLIALARLADAERASARHDPAAADAAFRFALHSATRSGVPADIAAVASAYVDALIATGDLPRASEVAGQLMRWADQDFDCALMQVRLYRALAQDDAWRASVLRARALAGERRIAANLLVPRVAPSHAAGGTDVGH